MKTPLPQLPPRDPHSHKGDFGRAVLVGGSLGMAGAIGLAGMATLRSGAGLVTVATPAVILPTVAAFEPSYMTVPLAGDEAGCLAVGAKDRISELADQATCLACGPGIGRAAQTADLVGWMYEVLPQPMVLDADGLYALSQRPHLLAEPAGPRILTPHPGEFRRFVPATITSRGEQEEQAMALARAWGVVLLLKGHRTLITDGSRAVHNTTGNPGMATGGSGDVLTGVITALVCQGLAPFEAAVLGAHLHGLAGDLAAEELGQVSMIASDLVRFLPAAFRRLS